MQDQQWRGQVFSGGGTPRPLKDYQAPLSWGPGAKAPGRQRSFILKVLEKESSFQKYNILLAQKTFFLRKISKDYFKVFNSYDTT